MKVIGLNNMNKIAGNTMDPLVHIHNDSVQALVNVPRNKGAPGIEPQTWGRGVGRARLKNIALKIYF